MPGRSLAFCAEAPERPNPSARVAAMTVVFIFGLPSLLLITNKHLSVRRPRCSLPIDAPRHDVAKTKRFPEVPPIDQAAAHRKADEVLCVTLGRRCALHPYVGAGRTIAVVCVPGFEWRGR